MVATGACDEEVLSSSSSSAVLVSSAVATAGVDVEAVGGLSPSTGAVGDEGLSSVAAAGGPVSVTNRPLQRILVKFYPYNEALNIWTLPYIQAMRLY